MMTEQILDELLITEHYVEEKANELSEESNAILEAFLAALIAEVAFLQFKILKNVFMKEPFSRKKRFLDAQRKCVSKQTAATYALIFTKLQEAATDVVNFTSRRTLNLIIKTDKMTLEAPLIKLSARIETGPWDVGDDIMKLWREMSTVERLTVNQWLSKLERNTVDRINAALVQAMKEGRSVRDTVLILRSKGIAGSRHGLEGLSRTWMASASNYARERQTEQVLGDRLQAWRYLAILDRATCLVCGNDDGKVFPAKGPRPSLPRHWRCRCLCLPIVKGWKNKPVSENYEQWMTRQYNKNPEFARRILGKTRFELFKSGKVSLSRMVAQGRVKKLSELVEES